jgi:uncharacterized protein involved in exopolysaccharide biosynthesis
MEHEASLRRRMIRDWWQILLLWLVVSLPLLSLIYNFVPQTYEAISLLEVQADTPTLYGQTHPEFGDYRGFGPYLQTQVQLMTSGRVLREVVRDAAIQKIPLIAESKDPEFDLRKKINVQIVKEAFLIQVALELPNADQAALIVNRVVDSS